MECIVSRKKIAQKVDIILLFWQLLIHEVWHVCLAFDSIGSIYHSKSQRHAFKTKAYGFSSYKTDLQGLSCFVL